MALAIPNPCDKYEKKHFRIPHYEFRIMNYLWFASQYRHTSQWGFIGIPQVGQILGAATGASWFIPAPWFIPGF